VCCPSGAASVASSSRAFTALPPARCPSGAASVASVSGILCGAAPSHWPPGAAAEAASSHVFTVLPPAHCPSPAASMASIFGVLCGAAPSTLATWRCYFHGFELAHLCSVAFCTLPLSCGPCGFDPWHRLRCCIRRTNHLALPPWLRSRARFTVWPRAHCPSGAASVASISGILCSAASDTPTTWLPLRTAPEVMVMLQPERTGADSDVEARVPEVAMSQPASRRRC